MTDVPTLFSMAGRTAVITGAAGLLGNALVRTFLTHGSQVAAVDIDAAGLDRLGDELSADGLSGLDGGNVMLIAGDVTSRASAETMLDQSVQRFGRVDALVNNAGGNSRKLPHEVTDADWDALLSLNLTSCFRMCQVFGRHMIERGGGTIVNVSSTCGCSAMGRGNFTFSVAKSGVNHLTRELALEWGASGVRVNAVAPSQVDSPTMREWMTGRDTDGYLMSDKFLHGVPLGRLVTAADVAAPVLFLSTGASAMITGMVLPVDGGNLVANAVSTPGASLV